MRLKLVTWILLIGVILPIHSQELKSAKEIIDLSIKELEKIESIEYEVTYQPKQKKNRSYPTIRATIFQQKEEVKDAGFDKALILAYGSMSFSGLESDFSFSYDGEEVLYLPNSNQKVKRLKNPQKPVGNLLKQHLMMLRVRPFASKNPYDLNFAGKLKERVQYYEKIEVRNGKRCYRVRIEYPMKMIINGTTPVTKKVVYRWWIDVNTLLPVLFSDMNIEKEIRIVKINQVKPRMFYSLDHKAQTVKDFTEFQVDKEAYKDGLLNENSTIPSWYAVSQDGTLYSRESLKGKIILLDFWGTWCAPCLKAMPEIQRINDLFSKNNKVVVIGVSANERTKNTSRNYFSEMNYSYVHIPNGDEIAKLFNVKYYPTVYLIDEDGKIVDALAGYRKDDPVRLIDKIKKLL